MRIRHDSEEKHTPVSFLPLRQKEKYNLLKALIIHTTKTINNNSLYEVIEKEKSIWSAQK